MRYSWITPASCSRATLPINKAVRFSKAHNPSSSKQPKFSGALVLLTWQKRLQSCENGPSAFKSLWHKAHPPMPVTHLSEITLPLRWPLHFLSATGSAVPCTPCCAAPPGRGQCVAQHPAGRRLHVPDLRGSELPAKPNAADITWSHSAPPSQWWWQPSDFTLQLKPLFEELASQALSKSRAQKLNQWKASSRTSRQQTCD